MIWIWFVSAFSVQFVLSRCMFCFLPLHMIWRFLYFFFCASLSNLDMNLLFCVCQLKHWYCLHVSSVSLIWFALVQSSKTSFEVSLDVFKYELENVIRCTKFGWNIWSLLILLQATKLQLGSTESGTLLLISWSLWLLINWLLLNTSDYVSRNHFPLSLFTFHFLVSSTVLHWI